MLFTARCTTGSCFPIRAQRFESLTRTSTHWLMRCSAGSKKTDAGWIEAVAIVAGRRLARSAGSMLQNRSQPRSYGTLLLLAKANRLLRPDQTQLRLTNCDRQTIRVRDRALQIQRQTT